MTVKPCCQASNQPPFYLESQLYITLTLSLFSRYSDSLWAGRSGDRIPVGARFSAPVQTGRGAHPASCTMGTGSFQGVNRPGPGADHPPPSNCRGHEGVGLYLYSPSGPQWPVTGRTFTLPLLLTWPHYFPSVASLLFCTANRVGERPETASDMFWTSRTLISTSKPAMYRFRCFLLFLSAGRKVVLKMRHGRSDVVRVYCPFVICYSILYKLQS